MTAEWSSERGAGEDEDVRETQSDKSNQLSIERKPRETERDVAALRPCAG